MDDNLQPTDDGQNDTSISSTDDQSVQPVVSNDTDTPLEIPVSATDFSDSPAVEEVEAPVEKSADESFTESVETYTETVEDTEEDTESYMDDTASI